MKTKTPSVSFVKNMLFLPLCAFVLLNWFILINFCMWYSVKFCFVRYFQRMIACTECQVCVHWAFSKQQIFLFALIQTKFIWALQSKFSEEGKCIVLPFWFPHHWGEGVVCLCFWIIYQFHLFFPFLSSCNIFKM